VFPGCVIGVSQNGTRTVLPFGHFTYQPDSPVVGKDTVYDCASITKSIPTASLTLAFVAEGKLRLDEPVKKFIPELHNDFGATIEDLLRYRVRGPRMSHLQFNTFEQVRTYILETGFSGPPGESEYTNLPAYVLGVALERIGNKQLATMAHEYFFSPLGMDHTTFFPLAEDCAPTEIQGEKEIRGIVHDESARIFARERRSVGHAGLFATAPDLLNFLDALLEGKYPDVLKGAQEGLGWTVNQDWFMGAHVSPKAFGKTGFTGTSIVVDRDQKKALVILSNRTYPTRPSDATSLTSAVNLFRRDIADIVFG
jgi:CubicO group peptidase (beta-lactamase class C family)